MYRDLHLALLNHLLCKPYKGSHDIIRRIGPVVEIHVDMMHPLFRKVASVVPVSSVDRLGGVMAEAVATATHSSSFSLTTSPTSSCLNTREIHLKAWLGNLGRLFLMAERAA